MKKPYSFRLDENFVMALDKRAKLERITRTQFFEKIGWEYLRMIYKQDQLHLEAFNRTI